MCWAQFILLLIFAMVFCRRYIKFWYSTNQIKWNQFNYIKKIRGTYTWASCPVLIVRFTEVDSRWEKFFESLSWNKGNTTRNVMKHPRGVSYTTAVKVVLV